MKPRILLVDDENENLKALERTLRSHFEVTTCSEPLKAIELINDNPFDVVVSDQRMPKMTGAELLAKVAEINPLITRVILTGYTETQEMLDAINRAEIYRYVTKPWDNTDLVTTLRQAVQHAQLLKQNQELISRLEIKNKDLESKEQELLRLNQNLEKEVQARTEELRKANERLSQLAMTDPLTKALNRRSFFARFDEEIERSRRYSHSLSVAMIDVDHFKPFNDMEGHQLGDEALKKVVNIIKANIRRIDVLCRYGGEEFCLLMPVTEYRIGAEICERLRAAIETTVFQGSKGRAYLTISLGLAGYPEDGQNRSELVRAADEALYSAKRAGRNRVVTKQENASFFVS